MSYKERIYQGRNSISIEKSNTTHTHVDMRPRKLTRVAQKVTALVVQFARELCDHVTYDL